MVVAASPPPPPATPPPLPLHAASANAAAAAITATPVRVVSRFILVWLLCRVNGESSGRDRPGRGVAPGLESNNEAPVTEASGTLPLNEKTFIRTVAPGGAGSRPNGWHASPACSSTGPFRPLADNLPRRSLPRALDVLSRGLHAA